MKLLWHSNAPWLNSGYGIQSGLFIPRIASLGHEITVSAPYSFGGSPLRWGDWDVLPCVRDSAGNDVLLAHYDYYKADLIIVLADPFGLQKCAAQLSQANCAIWFPVDTNPVGIGDIAVLRDSQAVPVAMSRYGQATLRAEGCEPLYVPHAVDCGIFSPGDPQEYRDTLADIDESTFIIGGVQMNRDPLRKGLSEQMEAFARFHARHPDSLLALHTLQYANPGINLRALAAQLGIGPVVIFPEQYLYDIGAITQENMAQFYRGIDVLTFTSYGEGFGIPLIEAQACFPAETPITATGVVRTMERKYTGDMITVRTVRGDSVTATAEHPFWTNRGWVAAGQLRHDDRLLYNGGHASIGIPEVHAGAIGGVVAAIRADAAEGCGRAHGHDLPGRVLSGATARASQAVLADNHHAAGHPDPRATGLYGWSDRRRGHRIDPHYARQAQSEAARSDRQLVSAAHGLAASNLLGTVDLHRAAEAEAYSGRALHVPHWRLRLPALVRGAAALSRHQGPANELPRGVHQGTDVADQARTAESALPGDGGYRSTPEYQAIESISRRAVRNLPVYNLTTLSGTYTAAGYLVHNCGTPVITTDASAMSELCGAGWLVSGTPFWSHGHSAWWTRPDVSDIESAYEFAYQAWKAGTLPKKEARDFALLYDADRVFETYWIPALEELEHLIKDKPAGDAG